MQTSVILYTVTILAASLAMANPLQARTGDCPIADMHNGKLCCMQCGCGDLNNHGCSPCLQQCICGSQVETGCYLDKI